MVFFVQIFLIIFRRSFFFLEKKIPSFWFHLLNRVTRRFKSSRLGSGVERKVPGPGRDLQIVQALREPRLREQNFWRPKCSAQIDHDNTQAKQMHSRMMFVLKIRTRAMKFSSFSPF